MKYKIIPTNKFKKDLKLAKKQKYKDNKSLILLAKPNVVPPKQHKKKKQKSRLDRIEELLTKFIKKQTAFNKTISKKIDNIEKTIDKIIKLNNLKTK